MSADYFDVRCEIAEKDGRCAVLIAVDGITQEQAVEIANRTKEPFKKIILEVLGAKEMTTRDMLKPVQ